MSQHWTTQEVDTTSNWSSSKVSSSTTMSPGGQVEATSTWASTKLQTATNWSSTDLAIDLDGWGILEALPIYFTDIRKWDELRITWGV